MQNVSNFINCVNKNIWEFLQNNYLQSNRTQQDIKYCWKASSIPAPFSTYTTQKSPKILTETEETSFPVLVKTPQT